MSNNDGGIFRVTEPRQRHASATLPVLQRIWSLQGGGGGRLQPGGNFLCPHVYVCAYVCVSARMRVCVCVCVCVCVWAGPSMHRFETVESLLQLVEVSGID